MKRGDRLLVISILATALGIYSIFAFQKSSRLGNAKEAVVEVNGEVVYTIALPILETKQVTIYSNNQKDWDVIEFDFDQVRVIESSCPQKIVIKMGSISRPGEQLICVPNRLVVYLTGQETPDQVDIISF